MLFYNELFKKIRESKGMTLEELGQKIGVSKQTVQKWEAGIAKPRPGKIYAMAKLLDVSIADLSDLQLGIRLIDSVEQVGIGNVAINDSNIHADNVVGVNHPADSRAEAINLILNSDELTAEKVKVLKILQK